MFVFVTIESNLFIAHVHILYLSKIKMDFVLVCVLIANGVYRNLFVFIFDDFFDFKEVEYRWNDSLIGFFYKGTRMLKALAYLLRWIWYLSFDVESRTLFSLGDTMSYVVTLTFYKVSVYFLINMSLKTAISFTHLRVKESSYLHL